MDANCGCNSNELSFFLAFWSIIGIPVSGLTVLQVFQMIKLLVAATNRRRPSPEAGSYLFCPLELPAALNGIESARRRHCRHCRALSCTVRASSTFSWTSTTSRWVSLTAKRRSLSIRCPFSRPYLTTSRSGSCRLMLIKVQLTWLYSTQGIIH
jgi:hypothetical protein